MTGSLLRVRHRMPYACGPSSFDTSTTMSAMPYQSRKLPLLLCVLCSLSAAAQQARVVTRVVKGVAPAWKTWTADGASMQYPSDWGFVQPAEGDTLAVFNGAADPTMPGTGALLVVALRRDGPAGSITERPPAGAVRLEVAGTIGEAGSGGQWTEYAFGADSARMRALELVNTSDGRIYTITYMASAGRYDEFSPLAQAMMQSFSAAR